MITSEQSASKLEKLSPGTLLLPVAILLFPFLVIGMAVVLPFVLMAKLMGKEGFGS